nr:TetR/AcrR family transcriptional regulator [uncultured Desulfobacter sp.]
MIFTTVMHQKGLVNKNHTDQFDLLSTSIGGEPFMKKIEQNKKKKRERILKAAQEIFQSNGFISTRMDKMAEQSGVTKQTVYHRYFESKEVLFKTPWGQTPWGQVLNYHFFRNKILYFKT